MAPKRNASALPKACQDLKEKLGDQVTGDNIAKVDRALRVRAFSALADNLKKNHANRVCDYQTLADDQQRRDWLASYLLDPEGGGSYATNTVEKQTSNFDKGIELWVTEAEYGGPRFLNSKEHAAIAVKCLQSRPHENPKLAEAKVLQYNVTQAWKEFSQGTIESSKLTTETKITAQEYAEVAESMRSAAPPKKRGRVGGGSGSRSSRARVDPASLTPQQIADTKSKEAFEEVLKSAKKITDKMNKEIADVGLVESRLKAKNWGSGPLDFLHAATEEQTKKKDALTEEYVNHKNASYTDLGQRDEAAKGLKELTDLTDEQYKAFKKNVLADFANIK